MTSNLPSADDSNGRLAHRDPWAPETSDANSHANGEAKASPTTQPGVTRPDPKSPAAISLRAFLLGGAFGVSLCGILVALERQPSFWRPPFFLLTLAVFHFLEYYITATYNPTAATVSAFLLSQNGSAYNVAHTLAFLECVLHIVYFFPSSAAAAPRDDLIISPRTLWLGLGFGMIVTGQATRTMAMVHAGSNFNHLVQVKRKQGHVLVTDGVYAWLRHPSYFGFWCWGLGTQVVLGNWICLVGYAVVLWRFFSGRIEKEEELLIEFFGDEYVQYRKRTPVGIPFIP
ncbi:hypothetical protein MMC07_005722 [Pseudocyphellaria aurata]|nr:hypothetical protein [Pseudocyphellaria aurata]